MGYICVARHLPAGWWERAPFASPSSRAIFCRLCSSSIAFLSSCSCLCSCSDRSGSQFLLESDRSRILVLGRSNLEPPDEDGTAVGSRRTCSCGRKGGTNGESGGKRMVGSDDWIVVFPKTSRGGLTRGFSERFSNRSDSTTKDNRGSLTGAVVGRRGRAPPRC
eukprot:1181819-Prorocentrum_minimum.AAC.2